MVRQTARRNQGAWAQLMLFMVLTLLLQNSVTWLHHATVETSTPAVCDEQLDTPDDVICEQDSTTAGDYTPADAETMRYPQRDRQVAKLLYASIFHPPQAS